MVREVIERSLRDALKRHDAGAAILMQLPADHYLESNAASVRWLIKHGYKGVYISFHRPFKSINAVLKHHQVDTSKLLFIDVARAVHEEKKQKHSQVIHITEDFDMPHLADVIHDALGELKTKKTFVFVDSLTTITLYRPWKETLAFSHTLVQMVRSHVVQDVILIFNVAKGLAHKKFVKDIETHMDETIIVTKSVKKSVKKDGRRKKT